VENGNVLRRKVAKLKDNLIAAVYFESGRGNVAAFLLATADHDVNLAASEPMIARRVLCGKS